MNGRLPEYKSNLAVLSYVTSLTLFICLVLFHNNAFSDPQTTPGCNWTVVNGPSDTCYTVTPTIDSATIDASSDNSDWNPPGGSIIMKNIGVGPFARARFLRTDDYLFFLITVDDDDRENYDGIEIHFDPRHLHSGSNRIVFKIRRTENCHQKDTVTDGGSSTSEWPVGCSDGPTDQIFIKDVSLDGDGNPICQCSPPQCTCPAPPCDCELLDSGFSYGWSAEVKISAADLDLPELNNVMGMAIKVIDQNGPEGNYKYRWPTAFADANPGPWANLKTRYPIHYALVLDNSGSMHATDGLSLGSRWERSKRATDLFVATAGLFKSPYFNDRVSLSQYSWSCSDTSEAGNTIGDVNGIAGSATPVTVPDAPSDTDATFTQGNTVEPDPNNCTPIKRGVDYALQDQLGFGIVTNPEEENRLILLLSDGLHNMPPSDVPFDPAAYTQAEKAFAAIRTVAMGDDCCIDTLLLQDMATAFNGASPASEGRYNIAGDFEELLTAYVESLQQPLSINEIPANAGSYTVDEAEKLVVIGIWNDASQASNMTIGKVGSAADNVTGTRFNIHIGYATVELENPAVGDWELKSVDGATSPDKLYFLVDLRVMAKFLVEQKSYGTGETIMLQVKLNDRAEPIQGAEVSVEVAKPGEGLGNFLSTIQKDCSMGRVAGLRSIPYRFDPRTNAFIVPAGNLASPPRTVDPLPGRHALAAYHLDRCNMDSLGRDTLPGLKLYDDGTHGDPRPKDGVYSLAFSDTDKEGSYKFRFYVQGETTDGMRFARTRTLSQYLRIKPVPKKSKVAFQPGDPNQSQQTGTVSIVPRDQLGNYLGPGFHHQIKFKTTAGNFTKPLVDHGNGTYSRLLSYDPKKDRPRISVELGDQEIGRLKVVKDFELVLPIIGWFYFDDELGLDDGLMVGAGLGYRYTHRLTFELEGGNTATESTAGDTGNVVQAMANVRYALAPKVTAWGELTPFVTAGLGYLFFNGFGNDDEAPAIQGGVGSTLKLNDTFDVRLDARIFWVDSVMGADASVNYQICGGLVVKF